MRDHLTLLLLFVLVASIVFSCPNLAAQSIPNQTRIEKARFRIVRSICGGKGSQQGDHYLMEDPRTVFYMPEDRQVIVYMELEGPIGAHRIEGYWRNPAGKVSSMSDFDYTSRDRTFSLYMTMAILESAETGTWVLAVHVDGEFVTETKFQLVAGARPGDVVQVKKVLSPAEVYQRALASTVIIESIGKNGDRLGAMTGFVVVPNLVVSSFHALDGASKIRAILPDGKQQEMDQILAWNRRQDYIVIKLEAGQLPPLSLAPENSWQVGDRAYLLDVAPEGNRVLSEIRIVGKNSFASAGERISLSTSASERAVGTALLNEYGEVIGFIGGPLYPGVSRLADMGTYSMSAIEGQVGSRVTIAVPIGLVDLKQTKLTPLELLARTGEIIPPVSKGKQILYAQLTHRIDRAGGKQRPADASSQFSHRDMKMGIFIMWDPKEKIKGIVSPLIYDVDNRPIEITGKAKDTKVNFQPGRQVSTSWEVDVSKIPAGVYRIEAQLNGIPYWRTYFQITD